MALITRSRQQIKMKELVRTPRRRSFIKTHEDELAKIRDYGRLVGALADLAPEGDFKFRVRKEISPDELRRIEGYYRDARENPDKVHALVQYGVWLAYPAGDRETAFKVFSRALKLNPLETFSHLHLGKILSDSGLFKPARLLLEEGLRLERNSELHADFHHALFHLGSKCPNYRYLMRQHSGDALNEHPYDKCPTL